MKPKARPGPQPGAKIYPDTPEGRQREAWARYQRTYRANVRRRAAMTPEARQAEDEAKQAAKESAERMAANRRAWRAIDKAAEVRRREAEGAAYVPPGFRLIAGLGYESKGLRAWRLAQMSPAERQRRQDAQVVIDDSSEQRDRDAEHERRMEQLRTRPKARAKSLGPTANSEAVPFGGH
jgi:hypothetical protein